MLWAQDGLEEAELQLQEARLSLHSAKLSQTALMMFRFCSRKLGVHRCNPLFTGIYNLHEYGCLVISVSDFLPWPCLPCLRVALRVLEHGCSKSKAGEDFYAVSPPYAAHPDEEKLQRGAAIDDHENGLQQCLG